MGRDESGTLARQGASRRTSMRAAEIYAEAIRVDESNALAHALLSICKSILCIYGLARCAGCRARGGYSTL